MCLPSTDFCFLTSSDIMPFSASVPRDPNADSSLATRVENFKIIIGNMLLIFPSRRQLFLRRNNIPNDPHSSSDFDNWTYFADILIELLNTRGCRSINESEKELREVEEYIRLHSDRLKEASGTETGAGLINTASQLDDREALNIDRQSRQLSMQSSIPT